MQANTRRAFGMGNYAGWMASGAAGFASLSGMAMAKDSAGRWNVPVYGELEGQN